MSKPLPPEIMRFFDEQKREQKFFEHAAVAQKNLRLTTVTLYDAMDKLGQRGVSIDMNEAASEQLMQSSHAFVKQTEPAWWRYWVFCKCIPEWWCTSRKKR